MSVTPNMNLTLPTPSVTPGPTWADEVNAAFDVIDAHDHTNGNGVPVPTAGLNVDDDLSFNDNALQDASYVGMIQQVAELGPSIVDSVYDVNGDLYFNNGAGTPVQITVGSSVNVSATALVPPGVVWPYGGTAAPTGFLLCDGSAVNRTTYSDLFLIIGTTFGPGDNVNTFNIPNMNGRAPIGAGTYTDPVLGSVTRTLGAAAGEASHVIITAEMAVHDHGGGAHFHQTMADVVLNSVTPPTNSTTVARSRSNGDGLDYQAVSDGTTGASVGNTSGSGAIITSVGNGSAHNTMQPYLVTNFIIKY